jgi:hypothetical protein
MGCCVDLFLLILIHCILLLLLLLLLLNHCISALCVTDFAAENVLQRSALRHACCLFLIE